MGVERAVCHAIARLADQMSSLLYRTTPAILIGAWWRRNAPICFSSTTRAMPSILIETCFVDSECDAGLYEQHFDAICEAIAGVLGGDVVIEPPSSALLDVTGTVSQFGGPDDTGVSADEGLAIFSEIDETQSRRLFVLSSPTPTGAAVNGSNFLRPLSRVPLGL